MNKSETIGELAKALSVVQGKLRPAVKDAQNPFFKSTYADLGSVWESCRQLLAENQLAVVQTNEISFEGVVVETTLIHGSGEWISSQLFLPVTKMDAQGFGSAITYGRRYGLGAMVGAVAESDDDGNAASQPKQVQQTAVRPSQTAKPAQTSQNASQSANGAMTDKQSKAIWAICKSKDVDENAFIGDFFSERGVDGIHKAELTSAEASDIIEALNAF